MELISQIIKSTLPEMMELSKDEHIVQIALGGYMLTYIPLDSGYRFLINPEEISLN